VAQQSRAYVLGLELITRRSQVRILAPLPESNRRPQGYDFLVDPAMFGSQNPVRRRILNEPKITGFVAF